MLETALDAAGGRVPVIAGVGALRSDTSAALARHAADAGGDGPAVGADVLHPP
ncbi:dihydrodipicolinate synthase family protein [Paracoccus sp. NBH48]|uniref:dihydrodipicolinate synthase family protein n=1 Tax=Paracoccus sp. NBH48 TaxID=2596918 RepID=UPI00351C4FB4